MESRVDITAPYTPPTPERLFAPTRPAAGNLSRGGSGRGIEQVFGRTDVRRCWPCPRYEPERGL